MRDGGKGRGLGGARAYFVADDLFLLLVIECWHREAALVLWVDREVDVSKVGKVWMDGIWGDIFAR